MELEVWPNFIDIAARRGIPVGIANGRVTEEKSMRRFRKPVIRSLARRMFGKLAFVTTDPIEIPRDLDDAAAEELRKKVEERLNAVTARAWQIVDTREA